MTSLTSFCKQHQLEQKLNHLFHLAQRLDLDHALFCQQMEFFDQIKADGMKFAENCCCWLHMCLVHFSLMLNFWRKSQELWQLVIQRKLGHVVKATTIWHLAKNLDIWNPLLSSLSEACHLLQMATQCYEALKPQHEAL